MLGWEECYHKRTDTHNNYYNQEGHNYYFEVAMDTKLITTNHTHQKLSKIKREVSANMKLILYILKDPK
jgi:hypothetical protein